MRRTLTPHPVADLFPEMPAAEFLALVEDIRRQGVRIPILVYRGQILDGRHRYRACQQLGVPCPVVQWNGRDPWLEVQSRNLVRRHLAKDQVYAIRKLAGERFPELAKVVEAAKAEARLRKAQAKGLPRGTKALKRSQDRHRESADVIGAHAGVSGATVKRVDRLARESPELLVKVAAGEMSVKRALREAAIRRRAPEQPTSEAQRGEARIFQVKSAVRRLQQVVRTHWAEWPPEHHAQFLYGLQQALRELIHEHTGANGSGLVSTPRRSAHVPESLAE